MSQPSNLWWVYDSQSGSFSTLPTGPFLVPALIIAGLHWLLSGLRKRHTLADTAGDLANSDQWKIKHNRYQQLVEKFVSDKDKMTLEEVVELSRLEAYLYNPHGFPR